MAAMRPGVSLAQLVRVSDLTEDSELCGGLHLGHVFRPGGTSTATSSWTRRGFCLFPTLLSRPAHRFSDLVGGLRAGGDEGADCPRFARSRAQAQKWPGWCCRRPSCGARSSTAMAGSMAPWVPHRTPFAMNCEVFPWTSIAAPDLQYDARSLG